MNNKTKYSLLTYLFLLLTLFILFIFTKDIYTQIVQNNEQVKLLEDKIKLKNDEYESISKIKSQIDDWSIKDINFNKFLVKFNENEIIDYFYSYANNHISNVKIDLLNLSEWKLNEFWFNEAKINLIATFNTEQDMLDMINFLLKSEKYNIYIHEFTYPFWIQTKEPLKIAIPLKVLYK